MDYNDNENETIDDMDNPTTEQQEEVKPISLSKKVTGCILIAFILVIIMVLCIFREAPKTKTNGNSNNNNRAVTSAEKSSSNTITKGEDTNKKNVENPTAFTESSLSTVNSTNQAKNNASSKEAASSSNQNISENKNPAEGTPNSTVPNTPVATSDSNVIKPIQEPVLSNEIKTTGLVAGKNVYELNNSYLYEISILVLTGNGTNTTCSYYCPKKTWDAVELGNSLIVTYQADSRGTLSISTISKQ